MRSDSTVMKYAALVALCLVVPTCWCQSPGSLRLVLGGPNSGRLEIFLNGSWGTVDKLNFGEVSGRIACQKLGFQNATPCQIEPERSWFYGPGNNMTGGIVNPVCNGTERSLSDCQHTPGAQTICQPMDIVSIRCFGNSTIRPPPPNNGTVGNSTIPPPPPNNGTDGLVRLFGGNDTSSGRLQIFINGTWGPVCYTAANVNPNFVTVACRALGYSGGGEPDYAGDVPPPQFLSQVRCYGNETSLIDCLHNVPIEAEHDDDLWLSCVPEGTACPIPAQNASLPPRAPTSGTIRPTPPSTRKPTTITVPFQSTRCKLASFFSNNKAQCLKVCKVTVVRKHKVVGCKTVKKL